jgi:hypothetical protein
MGQNDVDPFQNLVYVAAYENNRIQVFHSNGKFVTSWGSALKNVVTWLGNQQSNNSDRFNTSHFFDPSALIRRLLIKISG